MFEYSNVRIFEYSSRREATRFRCSETKSALRSDDNSAFFLSILIILNFVPGAARAAQLLNGVKNEQF